jgi:hypothetical protein
MSFDPRKTAIDEHKRWLGYLQPEGVVVAPVALVDYGAQLDASTFASIQERFIAATAPDPESGAPVIPHFGTFARTFLGWRDDLLDIFSVEAEVPDALKLSTGEFGELLHPDAALRYLVPADPARPWMLLVRQLPQGTKFDEISETARTSGWVASPAQKFERLLRAKDISIGIMANGAEVRLLYAPRGENVGSLTFPVRFMSELAGRAVVSAFEMLLSHRRLITVSEASRLPALLKKSREYQGAVSTALAEQVLEALYELVRGFQAADNHADKKLLREVLARDPDEVYHALLTMLLRLVFLLFAEDRGLMPGSSLYQRNYSIHGLFEKLRSAHERYPDTMDSRFGSWSQILTLCRLVFHGSRHWDLKMPARQGHLFDPDRFPFLEGRNRPQDAVGSAEHPLPCVSDGTLYRVLHKLLLLEGERLSYRALDVEQIGSVYQTMIGFTLEVAQGTSIALKPAKSKGAPAFIDLDELLAAESGKRAEHLQKLTDHKLTGNAASALKSAQTQDDLLAALDRKIAKAASPDKVSPGSLILQPTDERRRSGSHYTPRALTAPIVRKTLEPILIRLGEHPTPLQILELKVCDPAVGSGAFLVEACRQLGDALVAAWQHHGGKPVIPPDEDELLHARRLVAQRCLYGVDRNPMATDLAKLSLWLSTLAKDHPFTFLDHSLRTGDALVGLSKKQIMAFHWDLTAPAAKDRQFGQQEIEKAVEIATSYRKEILEGGDYMLPGLKAERLKHADHTLDAVRRAGDLCVAAFFDAENPKARTTMRENYLDTLLAADPKRGYKMEKAQEVRSLIERLRGIRSKSNTLNPLSRHSVTPFHWPIEFPEVFGRENGGFDAFIGNPPYGGKNTVIEGNHANYLDWLKTLHEESHGNADLVAHFFRRAFNLLRRDGTFGLIATNTIRQGDTRHTGLRWICTNGGTIYSARRRYRWVGAAAVVVSVVWIVNGGLPAPFDLDGQFVPIITAYLFHDGGHDTPMSLARNSGLCFEGVKIYGPGFTFEGLGSAETSSLKEREALLKCPKNTERIFPYLGGEESNDSPTHSPRRYVINFEEFPLQREAMGKSWNTADAKQREVWLRNGIVPEDYPAPVAADWPELLRIVSEKVKPNRDKDNREQYRRLWWQFGEKRTTLTAKLAKLSNALICTRVQNHWTLTRLPTGTVFSDSLDVFCLEQDSAFAILQSRVHEAWIRFFGSSMKDDLRYTPTDCFETFPFPLNQDSESNLGQAGKVYLELRSVLMIENNQGLTKTYNRFHDPSEDSPGILHLRKLHAEMDHAVLTAYGWNDLIESGRTTCEFIPDYYDEPEQEGGEPIPKSIRYRWPDATRDEVLARLLKLNAERAAEEGQTLKPAKTAAAQKPKPKKASIKAPKTVKAQLTLGIGTPSGKDRVLPTDFRLPASQSLLYTTNLVLTLISEAGGSLAWPRLLEAYVLATNPQLMERLAPAELSSKAKAWAARWNETVKDGLLLASLNQLGARNLTVTEGNDGPVFHLLDGPRPSLSEDVRYDAWIALRVAATLTPDAIPIPQRAKWTKEAKEMVPA